MSHCASSFSIVYTVCVIFLSSLIIYISRGILSVSTCIYMGILILWYRVQYLKQPRSKFWIPKNVQSNKKLWKLTFEKNPTIFTMKLNDFAYLSRLSLSFLNRNGKKTSCTSTCSLFVYNINYSFRDNLVLMSCILRNLCMQMFVVRSAIHEWLNR